jgi:hypothetical protein
MACCGWRRSVWLWRSREVQASSHGNLLPCGLIDGRCRTRSREENARPILPAGNTDVLASLIRLWQLRHMLMTMATCGCSLCPELRLRAPVPWRQKHSGCLDGVRTLEGLMLSKLHSYVCILVALISISVLASVTSSEAQMVIRRGGWHGSAWHGGWRGAGWGGGWRGSGWRGAGWGGGWRGPGWRGAGWGWRGPGWGWRRPVYGWGPGWGGGCWGGCWNGGWGWGWGGPFAAGLAGSLLGAALVAPAYSYPPPYYATGRCFWSRQRVYDSRGRLIGRRVQICR